MMYEFIAYQVRDVMTSDTIAIHQEATLTDAEAIFEEHDFNGLPVVDGNNRFIGFITKLDVLKAFAFTKTSMIPPYESTLTQEVSQVMNKTPQVVFSDTSLTRVLTKMIETGFKSFPVVEEGRVTGIVAREDVLHALREAAHGKLPDRLSKADRERSLGAKKVTKGENKGIWLD